MCNFLAQRDASNGAEIVRYISEMTGIYIEIIDGKEEARIVYDSHSVDILDSDGNLLMWM